MTRPPDALFRADASVEIGAGHVMRCLALAAELRHRGWTARLAARELHASLDALVRDARVVPLRIPEGIPLADEPALLRRLVPDGVAVVITDHYGIDATWHDATAGWARSRMAMTDRSERPLAADLVLDPNLDATAGRYAGRTDARLLLGPRFALLDRSFAAARASARPRERVGRVLVSIGGADPADVTGRAARAAATLGVPVDVVVGGLYPHRDRLEAWAATQPRVEVHVATRRMAELMLRADVAVGAPGATSWERSTLGLPAVLVTVADNQLGNAAALAAAGAAVTLGRDDEVDAEAIAGALARLRSDPPRLRAMSEAAAAITDGEGARRVADAVEALGVRSGVAPRAPR